MTVLVTRSAMGGADAAPMSTALGQGRPVTRAVALPDRAGLVPLCPACSVVLDGGPVVFICSGCGRGVMAADVSAERTP